MKTFEIEIKNLGPIRDAKFFTSHFNLLCGKNNSGKSMCMHAIFCFLSKWRNEIHLSSGADIASKLQKDTRHKFDSLEYVAKLNPALQESAKEFSSHLHLFLNKSKEQFKDCEVCIQMDSEYIRERLTSSSINVYLSITETSKLVLRKESNTTEATMLIENRGDGEFPSRGVINAATNRLLDYLLVETVLPRPYLMTAERSGSILYGDDLRTNSFLERFSEGSKIIEKGVHNVHYAYPFVCELRNIWDAQSKSSSTVLDIDNSNDAVIKFFGESVALGEYKERDGVIYYKPNKDAREFCLNEVSTSVRALMQLDYFVKRTYVEPNLLLMIDEPELNLHPERQRALARFLVLLMKKRGVGIAISTHSDIIVREINTLLAFGVDVQSFSKVMTDYGYDLDEFLQKDEVACGVVEKGTVETKESDRGGFAISSFDETYDKINSVQDAIISLWTEKQE
jgi:energy-coupling factor transporter ATP-binding protein EcfA2